MRGRRPVSGHSDDGEVADDARLLDLLVVVHDPHILLPAMLSAKPSARPAQRTTCCPSTTSTWPPAAGWSLVDRDDSPPTT
jgi:hypothetical protein